MLREKYGNCDKRTGRFGRDRAIREGEYARARFSKQARHEGHTYDLARQLVRLLPMRRRSEGPDLPSRPSPHLLRLEAEQIHPEFAAFAEQWRRETKFSSSLDDKVLHSAYQSIIAMGLSAVPLVLKELESRRGHWFWALHFMTEGANPIPEGANVDGARDAWLRWGRQEGYLE
jgi:hypothetical protein